MVLVLGLHGGDISLDVPRQLRQRQQQRQEAITSLHHASNSLLKAENQQDLADVLFEQCGECNKMASLPQAAFAVHKLRKPQNEKNLTVARQSMDKQESPRYMKTLDLTPVKYSDKLMNSIWGLYNRYSPHNFKKNNGSDLQYFSMPQP